MAKMGSTHQQIYTKLQLSATEQQQHLLNFAHPFSSTYNGSLDTIYIGKGNRVRGGPGDGIMG